MIMTLRIVSVIGHLKEASKTSQITAAVTGKIEAYLKEKECLVKSDVIELSTLCGKLFEWGNADVQEKLEMVASCHVLIVASPTFKASFTGLLKSFLDMIPQDGLLTKRVVPVMVGAAPHHSLAVELQLRPVLTELGAACTPKGLYILDSQMEQLPELLDKWLAQTVKGFSFQ